MALTEAEIRRYVEIANVNHLPKKDFYLSYDAQADVAYINFHNPAKIADDSELTDNDVIIRYDEQGEVVGLTILHASKHSDLNSEKSNGAKGKKLQTQGVIVAKKVVGRGVVYYGRILDPNRRRTKPRS